MDNIKAMILMGRISQAAVIGFGILSVVSLAGCMEMPDEYAGDVTGFNGHMVEIEGAWDGTGRQQPTEAMLDQARTLCAPRAAVFVSSTAKDNGARTIYSPYGTSYVSAANPWPQTVFRFACMNP